MPVGSFTIWDLVDIDDLKPLLSAFSAATNQAVSLTEPSSGEILVNTGYQTLCRKFHRTHPEASLLCQESNVQLSNCIPVGEVRMGPCQHGLMAGCTPIIIEDRHLANLFIGQVLFSLPS
ncbi:MAG: PocR ligand-binding domain-containing protein [Syntrophotaleaceae bacterium]